MRYYIRENRDAWVEGPFTVEELAARIEAGTVSRDSLVASEITGDALGTFRDYDWSDLASIPELQQPAQGFKRKRSRATPASVASWACVALVFLTLALLHHGWLDWVLAAVTIAFLVHEIVVFIRLKRRRELRTGSS